MMVDRCHFKNTFSMCQFKVRYLQHDRYHFCQINKTYDQNKQRHLHHINAVAATNPPSAREPVSPINTLAG